MGTRRWMWEPMTSSPWTTRMWPKGLGKPSSREAPARGSSSAAAAWGRAWLRTSSEASGAGLCHDTYSAHQGVEHDDMNVICLGSRVVGPEVAKELVLAFLKAEFTGEERHVRRLNKVRELEKNVGVPEGGAL